MTQPLLVAVKGYHLTAGVNEIQQDTVTEAGISNSTDDVIDGKIQDIVLDTINAAEGEYSEADYKKVLRKIDLVLLPLMWLCYGTQQADKTSTSTQATFGLRHENRCNGEQAQSQAGGRDGVFKGTVRTPGADRRRDGYDRQG